MEIREGETIVVRPAGIQGRVRNLGRQLLAFDYSFLILSLTSLIVAFTLLAPRFLSPTTFVNILFQSSIVGFTAVGMTFMLVSGEFDISVGSVAGLVGVIVAKLLNAGVPVVAAIPAGLCAGALIGLINGLLVTRVGLGSLVVTLGMLAVVRGAVYAWTEAVPEIGPFPSSFEFLGVGRLGPLPFVVVLLLLAYLVGHYFLRMSTFGRAIYATGGNEEAARLCGLNVKRLRLSVFVLTSCLAALAGMTLTARLGTAWPGAATGLEFQAITVAVMGGTSLFGGRGTIAGTLLGILVIGLINNGLSILNVSPFQIQLVNGCLILTVVLVDRLRQIARQEETV